MGQDFNVTVCSGRQSCKNKCKYLCSTFELSWPPSNALTFSFILFMILPNLGAFSLRGTHLFLQDWTRAIHNNHAVPWLGAKTHLDDSKPFLKLISHDARSTQQTTRIRLKCPRAESDPPLHSIWPTRVCKDNHRLVIRPFLGKFHCKLTCEFLNWMDGWMESHFYSLGLS